MEHVPVYLSELGSASCSGITISVCLQCNNTHTRGDLCAYAYHRSRNRLQQRIIAAGKKGLAPRTHSYVDDRVGWWVGWLVSGRSVWEDAEGGWWLVLASWLNVSHTLSVVWSEWVCFHRHPVALPSPGNEQLPTLLIKFQISKTCTPLLILLAAASVALAAPSDWSGCVSRMGFNMIRAVTRDSLWGTVQVGTCVRMLAKLYAWRVAGRHSYTHWLEVGGVPCRASECGIVKVGER